MSSNLRITWTILQCLVLALAIFMPASPAAAATDRLPDLGMARLRDIQIENTADGRRLLRFSTIIVNVGSGAFEVHGQRPDTNTVLMSVRQRIFDDAGGYRDVATPAQMFFSGDGHNHWHVRDLETYELIRLDNGVKVGTGTKIGFCFFDNVRHNLSLPGAPGSRVYRGCGASGDLSVITGLSIGWGDIYPYTLAFQYIDITGLAPGKYRLQVTADDFQWFQESNESNNVTWVDIRIKSRNGTGFRIIRYGPSS